MTLFLQVSLPGGVELLLLLLLVLLFAVVPAVLVYRDAQRRGRNAPFWAVLVGGLTLVGFVPGLVALVVYLWTRRGRRPVSVPNY